MSIAPFLKCSKSKFLKIKKTDKEEVEVILEFLKKKIKILMMMKMGHLLEESEYKIQQIKQIYLGLNSY